MNHSQATKNREDDPIPTPRRPALLAILFVPLAGCINLKAPDRPIEINLNINVKQEVVVSLKKDAEDFITSNPELFPK